ncbi:MAG: hypothetical protein BJ554DRAFT_7161 [Olpidium bornovanus]|uniref:Uncharacterized protein n=1 Tax=Olpidium bornovanus TaxID=278681 RepID=A0A8H7ZWP4_9FUNG|nr:MAG: hypothetical protein BJ554DRAFT_7161 [Olpidium bornovanus]
MREKSLVLARFFAACYPMASPCNFLDGVQVVQYWDHHHDAGSPVSGESPVDRRAHMLLSFG